MKQGKYKATAKDNLELDDSDLYWTKGETYDAEVNEIGEMTLQSENGQSYYTPNAVEKLKNIFDFKEDNDRYTPKKLKDKIGLKLCPFCGGKAEIIKGTTPRIKGTAYGVYCQNCRTLSNLYGTKRAAKRRWNRRADNE